MKIIIAVVQPFMLSRVTHALEELENFPGMTVTDAYGFGASRRKDMLEEHIQHIKDYNKKSRIEIVATDDDSEEIVETIRRVAQTGKGGDGKIFVLSVESAVRIQTGQTGEAALWS
jgi:nitrogen regulatory protein PII